MYNISELIEFGALKRTLLLDIIEGDWIVFEIMKNISGIGDNFVIWFIKDLLFFDFIELYFVNWILSNNILLKWQEWLIGIYRNSKGYILNLRCVSNRFHRIWDGNFY
jgi:hypothetical protein